MVEFTLPIVLQLLQTAGILVGIIYYTSIMRNNQKNQQIQLETRQAQLFMQMYQDFKRPDVQKAFHDIVYVWEWDSFEDYQEKYGRSNWDERQKYMLVYSIYEGLGVLIYRGLIDVKMIDELMRSYVTRFWEKVGPVMIEVRSRYDAPLAAEWMEYLYKKIKPIESTPAYLLES